MYKYPALRFLVGAALSISMLVAVSCVRPGPEEGPEQEPEPELPLSSECGIEGLTLKKSLNPGLASDIEFSFDEKNGVFSAMYLKWIEGGSPEMLKPSFEHEGNLFVDGKLVKSDLTAISFADDFTVISRAGDGTEKSYKVVFNCPQINRELPVLHMRPERLIDSKTVYVKTYLELYDKTPGSTGEGWWDSAKDGVVEARRRGNSTWSLPKKPFRLKFPEKFSPIGLNHAEEKSWALLGQDMDKSLIRTHIGFEYSRILFNPKEGYHDAKCVTFTPCSKFVNLYFTGQYYDSSKNKTLSLDGDYLGVYELCDQIERGEGRVDIEKLTRADGNDPAKISGGYLLEADLHEGNHHTSKRIQLSYKYPEEDDYDQSQYDYITNFLNTAESVLYGSNYKDPENGWRKYFDEKSLADFIIVKEFVGDLDGYTSTFMYKRRGCDKIFFGPVWDFDKGWDNDTRVPHGEYKPLESLMIFAGFYMPSFVSNDWFQRFWTDESFRSLVRQRWLDKKDELIEVTDRLLDELPLSMSKAIEANFTVWPFYYQYYDVARYPAKTYELEIERIRELSERREKLLDNLFR